MSNKNDKIKAIGHAIDQLVSTVAPGFALERKKAQFQLEVLNKISPNHFLGRAFDTGADRFSINLTSGSADYDAEWELPELRRLSRIYGQNNAIAAGALKLKTTMVIGSGLLPNPQIDGDLLGLNEQQVKALETELVNRFALWATSTQCDREGVMNFYELQAVAYRQIKENGDVLAIFNPIDDVLTVQLVEADLICNPNNQLDAALGEYTIVQGVAKLNGQAKAYYVSNTHPQGDVLKTGIKWVKVDRFNAATGQEQALLLANRHRSGMTRGLPDLTPVLKTLIALETYTKSEQDAAIISAIFGLFIQSPSPDTVLGSLSDGLPADLKNNKTTVGRSVSNQITLGANAVNVLGEGESIQAVNSNRPNQNFGGFVDAVVKQIAMAIEIPPEVLFKSFNSSYSASRASLLEAWRVFNQERRWFAQKFCQPTWNAFIDHEVMNGNLNLPQYALGDALVKQALTRCEWVGTAQGQIDEVKEATAAMMRVQSGFSTMEQETAKLSGNDWEVVANQRAKERSLLKEKGLDTMTQTFQVYINQNGGTN